MKKPYIYERTTYPRKEMTIAEAEVPMAVAKIAIEIVRAHAMVAAIPDGEDSAGRQKVRLPTAQELTARACDLAEAMWLEFEKRDWLADVPEPAGETDEK